MHLRRVIYAGVQQTWQAARCSLANVALSTKLGGGKPGGKLGEKLRKSRDQTEQRKKAYGHERGQGLLVKLKDMARDGFIESVRAHIYVHFRKYVTPGTLKLFPFSQ